LNSPTLKEWACDPLARERASYRRINNTLSAPNLRLRVSRFPFD
jgi:hypothetical protein